MNNNRMIESAKKSQFPMPFYLLPLVAFGINLMGDMLGGTLATSICDRFHLAGSAENRILLLSVAVNALLVLLWVKFIECRKVRDLGLRKDSLAKEAAFGAAVGFMTFVVIVGLGCLAHVVTYQSADFTVANILSVLLIIPFWIVQAGAEEILTRGWVLPAVSAKSNKLIGILISSALFVSLHANNAGLNAVAIINIFLVGVLLALYTLKSDSLWGAIMYHAFWNFTQGSFFGLSVSGGSGTKPNLMNFSSQGNLLLSGGRFGIEASIITTAVLVLTLAILLVKNKTWFQQSLLLKCGNEEHA